MLTLLITGSLLALCVGLVCWSALRQARRREQSGRLQLALGTIERARTAVQAATDEWLCSLWRRSGEEIRNERRTENLDWYADLRRAILDELLSRDPDGIAYWMNHHHPDADPSLYLHHWRDADT